MSDTSVPPPRYKQYGGFRELITDEQEWLARPAPWGIGILPVPVGGRKQAFYWHYSFRHMLSHLKCDACRPVIVAAFAEDGFDVPPECQHEGDCDGGPFHRVIGQYHRGVVTHMEVFNRLLDVAFQITYRAHGTPEEVAWNRAMALELVGPNPFRPVAFDPSWRTSTVEQFARAMDESRDFSGMPVFADALQEAGCDNDDILRHCRGNGLHVRGCWVVDLVLGKS